MRKSVIVLLAVGLAQMGGDLLHVPSLKGVAAATAASPAPKVFSSVRGLKPTRHDFLLNGPILLGRSIPSRSLRSGPEDCAVLTIGATSTEQC